MLEFVSLGDWMELLKLVAATKNFSRLLFGSCPGPPIQIQMHDCLELSWRVWECRSQLGIWVQGPSEELLHCWSTAMLTVLNEEVFEMSLFTELLGFYLWEISCEVWVSSCRNVAGKKIQLSALLENEDDSAVRFMGEAPCKPMQTLVLINCWRSKLGKE